MDPLLNYMGAEELGLNEEGQHSEVVGDVAEAQVATEIAELTAVIEEQTAEIEKLADHVEATEEAVEELEEAVEGMESMLNSGNFNSISFTNTYNRALRTAAKLGCEFTGERVGAESMGDIANANLMARAGIEAIGETLKNWGTKAVNFIKHIFNTIINFFVSIVSKADGLQRRAEQLRKRINDGAAIKKKIKLGGWNVYIDYASAGLGGVSKRNKGTTAGTDAGIAALVAEAGKVDGIELGGVKSAYGTLVSGLKADATAFGKYNAKKQGSKDLLVSQSAGVRLVASFSEPTMESLNDAASAIRSVSLSVGKAPEAKKLSSGEVAAKADKSGLISALDSVKAKIAAIRENKLKGQFTNTTRDQIIGKLNNVKAADGDKSSEVNGKVAIVKAVFALAAKLTAVGERDTVNVAGATLDAVAAHLGFGKE